MTPGWTAYQKRLQYQEYDVTQQLTVGKNIITSRVAEGWYKGPLLGVHHLYGDKELINVDNIEAVVIHTDMPKTGKFETSNELLNQLQHNILWGQKSNFLDIPTDCPQRDERLGWTGDAEVFFKTATFNMNVSAFFVKWMADLRAEQLENGGVPGVIPNIWGTGEQNIGQAGWADAATIIPWQWYEAYGDREMYGTKHLHLPIKHCWHRPSMPIRCKI